MADGGVPGVEDVTRLSSWLADNGIPAGDGPPVVKIIGGGRSNLTYRLDLGPGRAPLILRRPPLGHVLPTAHDMAREYRVITALNGTAVPVPRPVALCPDPSVVGAPFYLMDYVDGAVLRTSEDAGVLAPGQAGLLSQRFVEMLARIHGLARRMLGSGEADEATQDIFVRTWQKLDQFRGESAFGTWLHRLAVNVVIERRRSFAIQRERMSDDESALDLATAPQARTDLAMDFDTAIEQLPAGAREILVLHDVEGYKHREIAALLGITTGTSKRQLHRARMLMRHHLGGL